MQPRSRAEILDRTRKAIDDLTRIWENVRQIEGAEIQLG
jgi:hypothetical protein